MKIKGQITILIDRDQTRIEIYDKDASSLFAEITLTPEELSSALSRLAYTPCVIEVKNFEKVGKKHENRKIEFEIPEGLNNSRYETSLVDIAQEILNKENEGWIVEGYFRSQDSFFFKNNKWFAICLCKRWN